MTILSLLKKQTNFKPRKINILQSARLTLRQKGVDSSQGLSKACFFKTRKVSSTAAANTYKYTYTYFYTTLHVSRTKFFLKTSKILCVLGWLSKSFQVPLLFMPRWGQSCEPSCMMTRKQKRVPCECGLIRSRSNRNLKSTHCWPTRAGEVQEGDYKKCVFYMNWQCMLERVGPGPRKGSRILKP